MECPKCRHKDSKVIDSRPVEEGQSIRRRRECLNCGYRFNTYERIERPPLLVIKRDGTRESFDKDKLMNGVMNATQKRPVSSQQLQKLVSTVEETLRQEHENEVSSLRIGELVMPLLFAIDEVAYIRFASVYREFETPDMFLEEYQSLQRMRHQNKAKETNE